MKKKRLGAALIVLGVLGALALGFFGEISQRRALASFGRTNVGCRIDFQFDRVGTYYVYVESGQSRQITPKCPIATSGDRLEVELSHESTAVNMVEDANIEYEYRGASARSIRQFQVVTPGLYRLVATGPNANEVVAVGTDASSVRTPWMIAAGLLAVTGVIGGITMIALARRRRPGVSDDTDRAPKPPNRAGADVPYLPASATAEVERRRKAAPRSGGEAGVNQRSADRRSATVDTSGEETETKSRRAKRSRRSKSDTSEHPVVSGAGHPNVDDTGLDDAGLDDGEIVSPALAALARMSGPSRPSSDPTPAMTSPPVVSAGSSASEAAGGKGRDRGKRGRANPTVPTGETVGDVLGADFNPTPPRPTDRPLAQTRRRRSTPRTIEDAIDLDQVRPLGETPRRQSRRSPSAPVAPTRRTAKNPSRGYSRADYDRDDHGRDNDRRDDYGRDGYGHDDYGRDGYGRDDYGRDGYQGVGYGGDRYAGGYRTDDVYLEGQYGDYDLVDEYPDEFDSGRGSRGGASSRSRRPARDDRNYRDDGRLDDGFLDDGYDAPQGRARRPAREPLANNPRTRALRNSRRFETELPVQRRDPRDGPGRPGQRGPDGYPDDQTLDDRFYNGPTGRPPLPYGDPAFDTQWDVPSSNAGQREPTEMPAETAGVGPALPQLNAFPPPPPPETVAGLQLDDHGRDYSGEIYPEDWDQPASGELPRPPIPAQVQDEWHARGDDTGAFRWWSPPADG